MYFLSFLDKKLIHKGVSFMVMVGLLFGMTPTLAFASEAEGGEETSEKSEQSDESKQSEQPEQSDESKQPEQPDKSEQGAGEEEENGANDDGDDGEDGEENTDDTATSTIQTGDADSGSQVVNEVNNSELDVTATASDETADEEDTSGEEVAGSSTDTASSSLEEAENMVDEVLGDIKNGTGTATGTNAVNEPVNYSGENNFQATNTASTSAKTGTNTASSTDDVSVKTGNANAFFNLLNKFNTTELNSEGVIQMLNGGDFQGKLDVSLKGKEGASQELAKLALQNMNDANLLNDVAVMAETGKNTACSAEGRANVETGDAKAGANLVNFGNNTFIESKYVVLSANVLGDFIGDIVLPGKDFFRDQGAKLFEAFVMKNSKNADVSVDADANATTGGNDVEGDGSTETGEGVSSSVVSNDVNSTGVGGAPKVNLTFNVLGDMQGDIFNLPDGVELVNTNTGFVLQSEDDADDSAGTTTASTTEESEGTSTTTTKSTVTNVPIDTTGASSTVTSTSTVVSRTNVSVDAHTGDNVLCGPDGARVKTGDALSGLVVLGLYNATFYGKNLLYGAVNIFGDLKGNVSFGQPDLWIGGQADVDTTSEGALPGSQVTYTYTLYNHGDADASEVVFTDTLGDHLTFKSSPKGEASAAGEVSWNIGDISAGEVAEVSYTVTVSDDIPYGQTYVTNEAEIDAREPDANMDDNTEELSIPLYRYDGRGSGSSRGSVGLAEPRQEREREMQTQATDAPELEITKTNSAEGTVTASSTVEYVIVIENNGGEAYHSLVTDVLTDEAGNVVFDQDWDLGTIKPDEEITLEYTVFYDGNTTSGDYTNSVYVDYVSGSPDLKVGQPMISETATSEVTVVNEADQLDATVAQAQRVIEQGRALAAKLSDKFGIGGTEEGQDSGITEQGAESLAPAIRPEESGPQSIFANTAHAGENVGERNIAGIGSLPWQRWGWLFLIIPVLSLLLIYAWKRMRED